VPGILQDLRVRRVGVLGALKTAEVDEQLATFGESGALVIAETNAEVGRA
jgi:hypothetical protein